MKPQLLLIFLFIFLLMGGVSAVNINFVSSTPNNATSSSNEVFINTSITSSSLSSFIYNFNGINYSIFDSSLKLWIGANNLTSVGDNYYSFKDYSNNLNDGLSQGTDSYYSSGKYGMGLGMGGVNGYWQSSTANGMNSSDFTWSLWFLMSTNNTASDFGDGIINQKIDNNRMYAIVFKNATSGFGKLLIGLYNSSGTLVTYSTSNNQFSDANRWYHLVITYNNTNKNLSIYKDNIIINSSIINLVGGIATARLNKTNFGFALSTYNNYLNGTMDDILYYNRSLSSIEIDKLYNLQLNKYDLANYSFLINQSYLNQSLKYNYTAFATNSSNYFNQTNIQFWGDFINPNLTIISPLTGNYLNTLTLPINITASDNQNNVFCSYSLDNGIKNYSFNCSKIKYIWSENITNLFNLSIFVSDLAGNINLTKVNNINLTIPNYNTFNNQTGRKFWLMHSISYVMNTIINEYNVYNSIPLNIGSFENNLSGWNLGSNIYSSENLSRITSGCKVGNGCMYFKYNHSEDPVNIKRSIYLNLSFNVYNYTGISFWYKGDGNNNALFPLIACNNTGTNIDNWGVPSSNSLSVLNLSNTEWKYVYWDFYWFLNSSHTGTNIPKDCLNNITLITLRIQNESASFGNITFDDINFIDYDKGSVYRNYITNDISMDGRYQEFIYNLAYFYKESNYLYYQNNSEILDAIIDAGDWLVRMQQTNGGWLETDLKYGETPASVGFPALSFFKAFLLIKNESRLNDYVYDRYLFNITNNTRNNKWNLAFEKSANYSINFTWESSWYTNTDFPLQHFTWLYANYSNKWNIYNQSINKRLNEINETWLLNNVGYNLEKNSSTNIGIDVAYETVSDSNIDYFYSDTKLPILAEMIKKKDKRFLNFYGKPTNYQSTLPNNSRSSINTSSSGACSGLFNYYIATELNMPYYLQCFYDSNDALTSSSFSSLPYRLAFRSTNYLTWESLYSDVTYTKTNFKFPQNYSYYSYNLNTLLGFSRRFIESSGAITDRTGLEFPQMIYAYDNDTNFWIGNETNIYFNLTNPYFSDNNGNFPLKINITRFGYNGDTSKIYLYSKNYYRSYNINNGLQFIYDSYHGYIYNNLSSNINTTNYNLTNCLIRYPNNSGQIINSNNVNFTIPSKNSSWFGNNYQLTESRPLEGEPFTISKTTSGLITTYIIESELNNEVTIPASLDVDCENLKTLSINGLSSTSYTCSGSSLILLGVDVKDSSTLSSITLNSYIQDQTSCTSFMNAFLGYIPFYGILFAAIIFGIALYIILTSLGKLKSDIDLDNTGIDWYKTLLMIFIVILVMSILIGMAYIFNGAICGL